MPSSVPRASAVLQGPFSIYLDAVRFLAALVVVLGHAGQDGLYRGFIPLAGYAHEAVMVFFVLSGCVVAASTDRPGETWIRYVVARASRIYSVVLPAIALSFGVAGFSAWLLGGEAWTAFVTQELRLWKVIGALVFMMESWTFHATLPWNDPFWSLNYEVWYYVIFGIAVFVPAGRARLLALAAAALIAGPSIVLLLPIWWLGVIIARRDDLLVSVPRVALIAIALAGVAVLWWMHVSGWDVALKTEIARVVPGFWRLSSSQRFVTDWICGLAVAAHFVAMRVLLRNARMPAPAIEAAIRKAASYTFSIYLFHRPLMLFVQQHFPNTQNSLTVFLVTLAAILAIVVALGTVTEQQRGPMRGWMQRVLTPGGRPKRA